MRPKKQKRLRIYLIKKLCSWYTSIYWPRIIIPIKRKTKISTTSLTHLQLLPPRYNLSNQKNNNKYLQLAWYTCSCCLCIKIFISKKAKIIIWDRPNISAAAATAFAIKKAKTAKNILDRFWNKLADLIVSLFGAYSASVRSSSVSAIRFGGGHIWRLYSANLFGNLFGNFNQLQVSMPRSVFAMIADHRTMVVSEKG